MQRGGECVLVSEKEGQPPQCSGVENVGRASSVRLLQDDGDALASPDAGRPHGVFPTAASARKRRGEEDETG